MKRSLTTLLAAALSVAALSAQETYYTPARSDTWVGRDAMQRPLENDGSYRPKQEDRTVGMFYFIWHGSHGYDRHANPASADQAVVPPTAADSLSPYNISELLREDPGDPHYGPVHSFHHWGEPYLGYYVADDPWVIRKQAQMMSDAGIDVAILDVTNTALYLSTVKTVCEVYRQMRSEGNKTPDICFIINSVPDKTMARLYEEFYKKGLYEDLWFIWKGKPLVLCPPEGITPEMAGFFTVRQSWFCSDWPWFGDGRDKWTMIDYYPQRVGWHEGPDKPEEISVSVATHPISGIGRSYHDGKQPPAEELKSGEGAFFAEQWGRALEVDPEFIFVTGWNEWVAMRFTDGASELMLGKPIKRGDSYFVDQYNEEFSRDIEPMRGGFGDNYYYQLVDFVRRYKGMDEYPVYRRSARMAINGHMAKWEGVKSEYFDDRGDVVHRDHFGWGRFKSYVNDTGRNDIILSRVACDGRSLYFYVQTAEPLTSHTDERWMRLFIEVKDGGRPDWEGFQYMVNDKVVDDRSTTLSRSAGGWRWSDAAVIEYRVEGNEMELAIPLRELGLKDAAFTVDFKWIDNAVSSGGIMECIDNGDSAPNGRFKYRFRYRR